MELKKDIKSELEKIKQMSGKDRIWYIYEYYKFHIVAVILAFTLLWVVGSSLYRQTFTTRLTFAIVNDRSGGEEQEASKLRHQQNQKLQPLPAVQRIKAAAKNIQHGQSQHKRRQVQRPFQHQRKESRKQPKRENDHLKNEPHI